LRRKTHGFERLEAIISNFALPVHLIPDKVGKSQVDIGFQEESIVMKRENRLGQDQISLGIFEDDREGFEGHREMFKDVDHSPFVTGKILGHRERMRVPGLAFGDKGGDDRRLEDE